MTRYKAFEACASQIDLIAMQAARFKPYIDNGIHVIIGHEPNGSVMIGGSHAYEVTHPPARSEDVDLLILRYLKEMIALPDARIAKR